MDSLTITIGRNIGETPMDELSWRAFKVHVWCTAVNLVPDHNSDRIVMDYTGHNSWQGVTEESYKVEIVGTFPYPADLIAARLEIDLAYASEHWHQDAIAYTIGKSSLVMPTPTPAS